MTESSGTPRRTARALAALALILPLLAPAPAAAIDIFSRTSEVDLLLRDLKRLKGLQVTTEVRFVTVDGEFLERVGVDFSGTVSGAVTKNNQPVQNAKLIIEAFQVRFAGSPPSQTVDRTGRQVVVTDAAGRFQLPLKSLVAAAVRQDILMGKVISLRFEATGKNGRKVSGVHLRAATALGGLLD